MVSTKRQRTKRKRQNTKRNPKRISRKKQRLTRKNTKMYKKRTKRRKQYTGGKRFRRYSTHDTYSSEYFESDLNKLIKLLNEDYDNFLPKIIISHSNCMKEYMKTFKHNKTRSGGSSIEEYNPLDNIPNDYLFIRHLESKNNSVKNDTTNTDLYSQSGGFVSPRKMYRKFQNKDPHLSDHGIYSGVYYFIELFKNSNFKKFFEDKVLLETSIVDFVNLDLGVSCLLRTWETALIIAFCYYNSLENKPLKFVLLLRVLPFNKEVEKIGERASKFFVKRGLGNTPHDNFEKQKDEFLEFINKLKEFKLFTGNIDIRIRIDNKTEDLYHTSTSDGPNGLTIDKKINDCLKYSLDYHLESDNIKISKYDKILEDQAYIYNLTPVTIGVKGSKIKLNNSIENGSHIFLKENSAIDISSYTNGNLLFTGNFRKMDDYRLYLGPLQYKYMIKNHPGKTEESFKEFCGNKKIRVYSNILLTEQD